MDFGRVLVTGGAGFIGSNIVERLISEECEIRVVDNLITGRIDNLKGFRDKIEFIEGDLRDKDTAISVVEDVDYVIHQAALPSVPRSVADPVRSNDHNVNATLNLLVASRDADVKKVVYASSSSVYGDTPTLPKVEDMKPQPRSPYAVSKLSCEYYCNAFFHTYGLKTVSLRYFNVFGPRQNPDSEYAAVIPKFIMSVINDASPEIFGDGEQSRDFSFIENVVDANLLSLKKCDNGVFNIACGERITVNELFININNILGKEVSPKYTDPRAGDVKHSLADVSAAEKEIGYSPKVGVLEGLKKTIKWYKNE